MSVKRWQRLRLGGVQCGWQCVLGVGWVLHHRLTPHYHHLHHWCCCWWCCYDDQQRHLPVAGRREVCACSSSQHSARYRLGDLHHAHWRRLPCLCRRSRRRLTALQSQNGLTKASGVARICCEEGQRWKLYHGALTMDFSSCSMTNSFVTNAVGVYWSKKNYELLTSASAILADYTIFG